MRGLGRTRRLGIIAAAAIAMSACSGGSDAETPSETDPSMSTTTDEVFAPSENEAVVPGDGQSDDETTGSSDDFDPEVVDDGLVPDTVDEVVLDDDVIIATDDGQAPTTTTEPPPGPADTVPPPNAPATTTTTIAPVDIPDAAAIRRVVSFSPTHTDTIAALGAAELLVGVDPDSDVPSGAQIERDQLVVDDLDIADLTSLDIDLVIIGEDEAGFASQDLAAAGFAVFDGARPATRADVEAQVLALAETLGRGAAGTELVAQMRSDAESILASLPPTSGLTYFHEVDPGLATYAPDTLIDALYAELGLTSIVPPTQNSFAFLASAELLAADPSVIVLGDIDCCGATAVSAASRPGWSDLTATRSGAIVEVPDDVANRWGTNIVELMRLVAAGVAAAA